MTANSPGEKRRRAAKRARDAAAYQAALAALPKGACCRDCKEWIKTPVGRACDLDSDHEGYARRPADFVCPRFTARS